MNKTNFSRRKSAKFQQLQCSEYVEFKDGKIHLVEKVYTEDCVYSHTALQLFTRLTHGGTSL